MAARGRRMTGLFVTLEGGDGVGKSTQALRLAEGLKELGKEVLLTREPGGSPLAEGIRKVILDRGREGMDAWAELLLFAASRAEHRASILAPALERGAVVICDRYSDATVAYQAYGRGLPVPAVKEICRWAEQGVRPQLTLLLDLPVAEGMLRVRRRALQGNEVSRFDELPTAFHQRVRGGYLEMAREEPSRFVVLDARKEPGEVTALAMRAILRVLERARPSGQRSPA